jgi:hypothetical protein
MPGLKNELTIRRLASGGLITNYYCTSRCAHCLYCCSPAWEKRYIDAAAARANLRKIKALGCHSVHIGGGEPFLNPDGLLAVLEVARRERVQVEYVETNSSWYQDQDSAVVLLAELKDRGLSTLLISISPFHNGYIPFRKVKGVIAACRAAGLAAFPWVNDFYREIDAFDDREPHQLAEYQDKFGPDYLPRLPRRYWMHPGGRALKFLSRISESRSLESLLAAHPGGCRELADVRHFHLDLFGHYIPGLCSGLAIRRDDLGQPLPAEQYPLLNTLFVTGIKGFLQLAQGIYGFQPEAAYPSKCHLCMEIRRHLALERPEDFPELQPLAFYENYD